MAATHPLWSTVLSALPRSHALSHPAVPRITPALPAFHAMFSVGSSVGAITISLWMPGRPIALLGAVPRGVSTPCLPLAILGARLSCTLLLSGPLGSCRRTTGAAMASPRLRPFSILPIGHRLRGRGCFGLPHFPGLACGDFLSKGRGYAIQCRYQQHAGYG